MLSQMVAAEAKLCHRAADPKIPVMLLKPKDAATALAVSERTLWELTNRKEIPHVQIGRAVRYDPNDLQEWVRRMKEPRIEKEENPDGKHQS